MSSGVVSSMNERTTLAFFLSHAAAICSSFTSAFCVSVSSTWTPSKSVFGDRGVDGCESELPDLFSCFCFLFAS